MNPLFNAIDNLSDLQFFCLSLLLLVALFLTANWLANRHAMKQAQARADAFAADHARPQLPDAPHNERGRRR